jgi:hypothetical protein
MANLKELKNRTWGALIAPTQPQLQQFFQTVDARTPLEKAAKPSIKFFSTFIPEHVDRAMQIVDRFMQIMTQPNVAIADKLEAVLDEYQRQKQIENPDLVDYALMVFITHHPQGKLLTDAIPPLLLRQPDKIAPIVDERTGTRGKGRALPPDGLEWFREDPFANEHHEHWHIVYPTSGVPDGRGGSKTKDRQGELFFYMHQQMLARYDAERLAQGLERVVPLPRDMALLRQGYDPNELSTINFLTGFSKRDAGKRLQSLLSDTFSYTLDDHELRRQRLNAAIDSGNFENTASPEVVTADKLGGTIESTIGTVTPPRSFRSFYGNYHGMGHVLIAQINQPDEDLSDTNKPGVMYDTAAAIRDPIFFQWHKQVDNLYWQLQEKQPSYDFLDRPYAKIRKSFDGITAKSSDIILSFSDRLPNDLQQFAESKLGGEHWDDDPAQLDFNTDELQTWLIQRQVKLFDGTQAATEHLVHREFVYLLRVENLLKRHQTVTVRIFMVPNTKMPNAAGNENQTWAEDRRLWIEMDKFLYELQPLEKAVIARRGSDSTINRKPVQMEPELILKEQEPDSPFDDNGNANPNWNDESNYCTCGWPYHLLLPRGNKEGMPFRLAIVLTDWELDKVGPDGCCGSLSFCGAIDRYPDKRPMGYPFDRPFNNTLSLPISETIAANQNMAFKDISIKWYEKYPRS